MRLLIKIGAVLLAMSGGYVWTVGQSGLKTTNQNLCDLVNSLSPWPLEGCKVQVWVATLWIALAAIATLCLASAGLLWIWRRIRNPSPTISPTPPSSLDRQIIIRAPTHQYSFLWDPPDDSQMVTKPRLSQGEQEPLGTRLPVFWLKNLGREVPGEIELTWRITGLQVAPDEAFLSSPRIQMFRPHRGEHGGICWETFPQGPPPMRRITCVGVATVASTRLDFPAPGRESDRFFPVVVPDHVWAAVELFSVASVYGMRGFPSVAVPLEITAKWATPIPGETKAEFHCTFFKMGGEAGTGTVLTHPPALRL